MTDLDRAGGVPVLLAELLRAGLLDGDALTVTGRTLAENLSEVAARPDGRVLRTAADPVHGSGGIRILHGSLAPDGAVVKVAGVDRDRWSGAARVFESEEAAFDAVAQAAPSNPGRSWSCAMKGPAVDRVCARC